MLIYVDIETTGYEAEDKICSIGVLAFEEAHFIKALYELVNEGKKIPSLASSVHNITNEMIENRVPFKQSEIYNYLKEHNCEANTLIVHNANLVLRDLASSGLKWYGKIIDTQKVVKHHISECEIFTLEFLRYELKLYKNEEDLKKVCDLEFSFIPHHALSDAFMIKLLFDYLKEDEIDEEMMQDLSFKSVLLEKFPFGKYVGRYIEEIAISERGYLEWLLSLENLDDDLRYSIEYYL